MSGQLPVNPIRPSQIGDLSPSTAKKSTATDGESPSFADVLKSSIAEVNQLKQEADVAINDLATGKTESFTEVLTAVEKADLAFRALMSIRNKLVDAYEEINRLRV